jgi:Rieske Fe-S protein
MQAKNAIPILLVACLIISSAEAKDGQEAGSDSLRNPLKNLVIDVRSIQPGQRLVVAWGMYPVWIIRRSDNELTMLAKEDSATLGDPAGKNWRSSFVRAYDVDPLLPRLLELDQVALEETPYRSLRKDIFVFVNVNPTSGCSTNYVPAGAFPSWAGGFYDECSHQFYDLAGRVLKVNASVPAWNFYIPPHRYVDDHTLMIGLGEPPRPIPTTDYAPIVDYAALVPAERLVIAARYGQLDMVKETLGKGISADTQDASGNRALVIAALKGHNQIVQYLLAHGVSPNLPNKKGVTPLHAAILGFNYKIAKTLIASGANVNAYCEDANCYGTPLNTAIRWLNGRGDVKAMARLLVVAGANPCLRYRDRNAIDEATATKQTEIVDLLKQATKEGCPKN